MPTPQDRAPTGRREPVALNCRVHPHEVAEGVCRSCGGSFCADCLIYPFGAAEPPYCVPCAISAAGVRSNARNRPVVQGKEKKQRLNEWRKAKKRDLAAPPPDGVATWHRMAEVERDDEDDDSPATPTTGPREDLLLPPPEPETPTPPPDVNLAPPGPAGTHWTDDLEGEGFGAGWAAPSEPDPGWAAPVGPPSAPDPAALVEPTPLPAPDPVAYEPAPYDPATVGLDPPVTPAAAPYEPAPYPPAAAYEPAPYPPAAAYEPAPYPPAGPYEPAPYPPAADAGAPAPYQPAPVAPEPPAAPLVPAAVTIDMGGDPLAASLGTPDPATAFGLGDDPLPPPPPLDDPATAPPVPTPVARRHHPTPPPPPPLDDEGSPTGIRPRVPTRIPAANPQGLADSGAQAMLDRIAALRKSR